MKKIDISITKAQITSFQVEIKDKIPVITAFIALLDDNGKKITSYSATTEEHSWSDDDCPLDVAPEIGIQIAEIMNKLEGSVVRSMNKQRKLLCN